MKKQRKFPIELVALLVIAAMLLAACGPSTSDASQGAEDNASMDSDTEHVDADDDADDHPEDDADEHPEDMEDPDSDHDDDAEDHPEDDQDDADHPEDDHDEDDADHPEEEADHAHAAVPHEYEELTNPFAGDVEAIAAGAETFAANCASCHGESGQGDGPAAAALDPSPADLSDGAMISELSDGYFYWRISKGGLSEPFNSLMPAWESSLSEDQIWQVAAYILTLSE
jgi:mono/diheme cytochrome c family protein